MSKPKKWTEVYPYGTKEGDEEARFFRALARHPKYQYRSTPSIIKDAGISKQRCEEIIDKYATKISPPLLYPHATNDDHWGYWERCEDRLNDDKRDISKKDKDSRVDKHISGSPTMVGSTSVSDPVVASSAVTTSKLQKWDLDSVFFDTLQKSKLFTDEEILRDILGYKDSEVVEAMQKISYKKKLDIIAKNPHVFGVGMPVDNIINSEELPTEVKPAVNDQYFNDILHLAGLC